MVASVPVCIDPAVGVVFCWLAPGTANVLGSTGSAEGAVIEPGLEGSVAPAGACPSSAPVDELFADDT